MCIELQMEEVEENCDLSLNLETPSHEALEEMMFDREEMMSTIDKQVVLIK